MYHKKIFVKENGDRVMARISTYLHNDKMCYNINISLCPKGKRKFNPIAFDDYEYRMLSMEDRKKQEIIVFLQHLTAEQIFSAKLEAWEKMKPNAKIEINIG